MDIDFKHLLTPIAGDSPAGIDIRAHATPTSSFYRIKDARAAARAAERRAAMEEGAEGLIALTPEWRPVLELAPQILATESKDLEVAAWYAEALLRAHGFAGLRDGLRLLHELIDQDWEGLYPRPDEEGLEARLSALTSLNGEDGEGTLIAPIQQVPITQGQDGGPYATWHYQQAVDLERIADGNKRQARISAGAVTLANIRQAAMATSPSWYQDLREQLGAAIKEYETLCARLEHHCGRDAPPSSNIKNALQRVREAVRFLSGDDSDSETAVSTAVVVNSAAPPMAAGAYLNEVIQGRDEAYRALLKVAEFFRRTEPHSPISYQLEQAVRWGRMPLPELLRELIPDTSSRLEYFRLVGIPKPPDEE